MAEPEAPEETVASDDETTTATAEGPAPAVEAGEPVDKGDYTVLFEDDGPCRKKAQIVVKKKRVEKELSKTFRELSRTVQVRGFRPGRVPRRVLERKFGKHVREDIQESLPHELLEEILGDAEFEPIGQVLPDNAALKDGTLEFTTAFDIRPQFELPAFDDLRVVKKATEVSTDKVDEELAVLAKSQARYEKVEDGIEDGDLLVCDAEYQGEGDKRWDDEDIWVDQDTDSIETFDVPDWKSACLGKKIGDVIEVAATDPDGGAGTMAVTVREIKRRVPPVIDDEWAKEQDFDDLKAMKEHYRSEEIKRLEAEAESEVDDELLKLACAKLDFDLPKNLIGRASEHAKYQKRAKLLEEGKSGDELEEALKEAGEEIEQDAIYQVRRQLLLEEIAKAEKIFVTEEEINARFDEIAAATGREASFIREYYDGRGMTGQLRDEIRLGRAKDWLREKAEIVDAENQ